MASRTGSKTPLLELLAGHVHQKQAVTAVTTSNTAAITAAVGMGVTMTLVAKFISVITAVVIPPITKCSSGRQCRQPVSTQNSDVSYTMQLVTHQARLLVYIRFTCETFSYFRQKPQQNLLGLTVLNDDKCYATCWAPERCNVNSCQGI